MKRQSESRVRKNPNGCNNVMQVAIKFAEEILEPIGFVRGESDDAFTIWRFENNRDFNFSIKTNFEIDNSFPTYERYQLVYEWIENGECNEQEVWVGGNIDELRNDFLDMANLIAADVDTKTELSDRNYQMGQIVESKKLKEHRDKPQREEADVDATKWSDDFDSVLGEVSDIFGDLAEFKNEFTDNHKKGVWAVKDVPNVYVVINSYGYDGNVEQMWVIYTEKPEDISNHKVFGDEFGRFYSDDYECLAVYQQNNLSGGGFNYQEFLNDVEDIIRNNFWVDEIGWSKEKSESKKLKESEDESQEDDFYDEILEWQKRYAKYDWELEGIYISRTMSRIEEQIAEYFESDGIEYVRVKDLGDNRYFCHFVINGKDETGFYKNGWLTWTTNGNRKIRLRRPY